MIRILMFCSVLFAALDVFGQPTITGLGNDWMVESYAYGSVKNTSTGLMEPGSPVVDDDRLPSSGYGHDPGLHTVSSTVDFVLTNRRAKALSAGIAQIDVGSKVSAGYWHQTTVDATHPQREALAVGSSAALASNMIKVNGATNQYRLTYEATFTASPLASDDELKSNLEANCGAYNTITCHHDQATKKWVLAGYTMKADGSGATSVNENVTSTTALSKTYTFYVFLAKDEPFTYMAHHNQSVPLPVWGFSSKTTSGPPKGRINSGNVEIKLTAVEGI